MKRPNEKIEACEPTPLTDAKPSELKIIAEGANSKIETPFVFIARDAKTYELLKFESRKFARRLRRLILQKRRSSPLLPE